VDLVYTQLITNSLQYFINKKILGRIATTIYGIPSLSSVISVVITHHYTP